MRQFDVLQNKNPETRGQVPYLLLLQADLFGDLATQVVAPVIAEERFGPRLDWLTPQVTIGTSRYVVSIPELAGVPASILGDPVASAAGQREELISALDFLFTGS